MTKPTPPTKKTRPMGQRGQGRKLGSLTKLTRRRASEIADSGHGPLDVMINNMHFWFGQAQELGEKLQTLVVNVEDETERKEARALVKAFLAARENAQRCAVDAAPYVHPRLQAIQHSAGNDTGPVVFTIKMGSENQEEPASVVVTADNVVNILEAKKEKTE